VKPKPKSAAKAARAAVKCSQFVRLSKQQRAANVEILPVKDCKCECTADGRVQIVFKANYRAAFRLDALHPCDETDLPELLPAGSELLLDGTLTLRQEPCAHDAQPIYIGTNEGTYRVRRQQSEVVFEDHFCGTVGVHPSKSGDERCCAHGQLLGSLCGKGINGLKGWSLCLSYDMLIYILDRINLCEPGTADAKLNLDGVLVRPCPNAPARNMKKKKR